jgi:hypothetical protein
MDKFRLSLAKLYAFSQGKQIKGTREIKFKDGRTKEVIVLEGKWAPIGQAIPLLNIILVGEQVFTDFSENLRQLVLEHEYAHLNGWWWQVPLLLFCIGGFVGIGLVFCLLNILLSKNLLLLGVLFFVLPIVLFVWVVVTIWPIDFFTQWSAINAIGFENAQKSIIEQKAKSGKMRLFGKILNRAAHVPPKWILCLYKWVHK